MRGGARQADLVRLVADRASEWFDFGRPGSKVPQRASKRLERPPATSDAKLLCARVLQVARTTGCASRSTERCPLRRWRPTASFRLGNLAGAGLRARSGTGPRHGPAPGSLHLGLSEPVQRAADGRGRRAPADLLPFTRACDGGRRPSDRDVEPQIVAEAPDHMTRVERAPAIHVRKPDRAPSRYRVARFARGDAEEVAVLRGSSRSSWPDGVLEFAIPEQVCGTAAHSNLGYWWSVFGYGAASRRRPSCARRDPLL